MSLRWQILKPGVFLIEADGFRPVLFAPLQGLAMEVNQTYVQRFCAALDGDVSSAGSLGLTPEILESFIQTPPRLAGRLDPKWSSAFEPTNVTVFLTHKCTMRCSYCYCHGGEGRDMPWPVFEHAVKFTADNARRLGRGMNFSVHGGDVGACWSLFQNGVAFAERICAEAGIPLQMTIGTNGFYSDEQARYVAEHVHSATLSVDGAPPVHDRYRQTVNGQPTLDRILRTARIFEEKGITYSVRMTVTDEAVSALPEGVDYICQNTQAKAIRAEPLYCRGRAATRHLRAPDPESFVDAFRKASQVARSHGRELSYSGARLIGVFGSFCSYPEPTFGVTPEGNLTCCYEILHPDDPLRDPFFFGKIAEDGSRMDVDPARVDAIRAWARNRRAECAGCFCVNSCAGDCAAKVMDGALPEDDVPKRCRITRALVYDMIRAVLSGENPNPRTFIPRADIPEGTLCNCVDCSKPATRGEQGSGIRAEPGSAP